MANTSWIRAHFLASYVSWSGSVTQITAFFVGLLYIPPVVSGMFSFSAPVQQSMTPNSFKRLFIWGNYHSSYFIHRTCQVRFGRLPLCLTMQCRVGFESWMKTCKLVRPAPNGCIKHMLNSGTWCPNYSVNSCIDMVDNSTEIYAIYHTTSDTLLREALFIFSSCVPSSHLECSLDVASRWAPKMPLATYHETSRTDPRVPPLSSLRWLAGKPPISIGHTSSNGGCFILMLVWLVWLGGCTSCFKFFPIDFLKAPPHHHHVGSLRKKHVFSGVIWLKPRKSTMSMSSMFKRCMFWGWELEIPIKWVVVEVFNQTETLSLRDNLKILSFVLGYPP